MLDFSEPFDKLLTQGMVLKDGEVMSKSKGNIVDPDEIIQKYGADTLRLFILFAAPPEAELDWNDRGMDGAWRFLSRVFRLLDRVAEGHRKISSRNLEMTSAGLAAVIKKRHQTVKKFAQDMEGGFKFNTAISGAMEFVNELYKLSEEELKSAAAFEAVEALVIMLSPFVPHLAEEMWEMLGHRESIFKTAWPSFDPLLLEEDTFEYPIQVNGKLRSHVVVNVTATDEEIKALALADPKTQEWLKGTVKKIIIVPKKLISIVVS